MKIQSEVKKKWDELKSHGDIEKICAENKLGRPTVAAALSGGDCSMEVFAAIQSFYNKRHAKINKLLNPKAA